jgi:hypothetical protein
MLKTQERIKNLKANAQTVTWLQREIKTSKSNLAVSLQQVKRIKSSEDLGSFPFADVLKDQIRVDLHKEVLRLLAQGCDPLQALENRLKCLWESHDHLLGDVEKMKLQIKTIVTRSAIESLKALKC